MNLTELIWLSNLKRERIRIEKYKIYINFERAKKCPPPFWVRAGRWWRQNDMERRRRKGGGRPFLICHCLCPRATVIDWLQRVCASVCVWCVWWFAVLHIAIVRLYTHYPQVLYRFEANLIKYICRLRLADWHFIASHVCTHLKASFSAKRTPLEKLHTSGLGRTRLGL